MWTDAEIKADTSQNWNISKIDCGILCELTLISSIPSWLDIAFHI